MKSSQPVALFAALLLAALPILPVHAQETVAAVPDGSVLPRPPQTFKGKLAPTEQASTQSHPSRVEAPAGAPNILLVMTDDVGFAASSTFGGPIPTPNLDRLAARGLKYNEFHTTAICSATRASLLTGRNHHAVGTAALADVSSPYPGYTTRIPKTAATLARILRDNGYNTAMFGKHHNVPTEEQTAAGPFDQWPTGWGFEYFYGFVGGDTNQWQPALYQGISPVDGSHRDSRYILERDLTDHAIDWLHGQKAAAPDKPFFIYYAPGTSHAPHQAPADWIAKFRGKFDQGWDQLRAESLARQKAMGIVPADTDLAPRPKEIPAWDGLSADEKQVNARYMEVYAGMLAYQDAQFGRLLDEIERMGIADNTLVVFIEGDNGASGEAGPKGTLNELVHLQSSAANPQDNSQWLAQNLDIMGGPKTYECYPVGWALALDTPFPWLKQIASHLGGVRNGLVISWPRRIKAHGELRTQYHHVTDILPTLLDAADIKAPTRVDGISQQRIDGTSMTYSFDAPTAQSPHHTQYYEMMGNRGIYHDGWLANTTPRNLPWTIAGPRPGSDVTTYNWELYDLRTDFSQTHDLSAKEPLRLKQMQALFDVEARRNNVYPIQDSSLGFRAMRWMRAAGPLRTHYVFWGKGIRLPGTSAPPIFALPFSIEADVEVPQDGANGVIVAAGSLFGGWSFYLEDGRPVAYAAVTQFPGQQFRVAAEKSLAPGPNKLRFEVGAAGPGGVLKIFVNGAQVAQGDLPMRPRTLAGLGETFDIGRDSNTPVSGEYQNEGVFTGEIEKVVVDLTPPATGRSDRRPADPD
jgi:arylsulfatase A-like enzyme